MITYSLIQGGYEIFVDGAKVIHQPHSPTRGVSVKLTEQEAEGIAKLICAKLEQGVDPTVLAEEEQEIRDSQYKLILSIAKNRNGQADQKVLLAFNRTIQRIREISWLTKPSGWSDDND